MSRFIETIKCRNGRLYNIDYHNSRFNVTLKKNYNVNSKFNLAELIDIPENYSNGLFKCRVLYSDQIHKIEFLPYKQRNINSLKLVEDNKIEYSFKYADREKLNFLFNQREECDDILIVKHGCITDSFYANTVFFDGQKWWTPDTPLLSGTQRAFLIDSEKIFITRITVHDLKKYSYAGLINAMLGLDEMPRIPISEINGID